MTYKAIVFDLGNVLIPFDYTPAFAKLNKIAPELGKTFQEYYKNNYEFHRNFEKGVLTETEFTEVMLKQLEHKVSREEFFEIYSKIFIENTSLTSIIPKLKENYKIILLSNTNSIHQEYGWKDYEFLKYFDYLVLSHIVKSVKPEQEIYKEVEKFTKFAPEEHLYIDDILEYVEAARSLGWDAIQFISNEQVFEELRKREVLNV